MVGHLPLYLTSIDLSVWPGEPLEILSEDLAAGRQVEPRSLEELTLAQSGTVSSGGTACAVQTKSSFAGWTLQLLADEPADPFGFEGLHLAIHPGDVIPGGTFYLDELRLVPGQAPAPPPTAVTETLPSAFALDPNFPNPFNSSTVIGFDLPVAADVDLALFDLLGQRVATLGRGRRPAGTYTLQWDGHDDAGQPLASGVYLYRLQSALQTETRKLLLVR